MGVRARQTPTLDVRIHAALVRRGHCKHDGRLARTGAFRLPPCFFKFAVVFELCNWCLRHGCPGDGCRHPPVCGYAGPWRITRTSCLGCGNTVGPGCNHQDPPRGPRRRRWPWRWQTRRVVGMRRIKLPQARKQRICDASFICRWEEGGCPGKDPTRARPRPWRAGHGRAGPSQGAHHSHHDQVS